MLTIQSLQYIVLCPYDLNILKDFGTVCIFSSLSTMHLGVLNNQICLIESIILLGYQYNIFLIIHSFHLLAGLLFMGIKLSSSVGDSWLP